MELQALKNKFDIIGNDPALNLALETAVKLAPTDLSVLITGETGSGKENISKIIHQFSLRRNGKFFSVNCGAFAEGLINSELFGHVKGAYTGASDNRSGYFEEANGGTLFLDEIAELPLLSQALLLRVLQNGEYRKVGSNKVERTDVRVIAATNIDLYDAVRRGKFREDLYYRLSAARIRVPSLSERKDDIYLLFRKFTSDFSEKYGMCKVALTDDAIALLQSYRWPGNIRQLMGFTESLTAQESMKITPTTQRIILDAATVAQYMPKEQGPNLPAVYEGDRGGSLSDAEKQAIFKAILDLKQEVDALKAEIHRGPGDIPRPAELPHHGEEPMEAEWQGETAPRQETKPHVSFSGDYDLPEEQQQAEDGGHSMKMKEILKENIRKALEKHGGNRKKAAEELGISERTIYRNLPEEFQKGRKA